MVFSKLKNIFSRLNPLNSFKWDRIDEEIIIPPSSEVLLEYTIKKYPQFEFVILISLYHLVNTKAETNEFLTVLTKDLRLIVDLVEGTGLIVETPIQVEVEGKKDNLLVAVHNHFFGAIIPSLGDICKAIKHNCELISVVSENHIGIIFVGYDGDCDKKLVKEFEGFHGYLDICFNLERSDELKRLRMLDLIDDEKEMLKLEIYDKFISENAEKFVDEFNIRLNKFNIYEIYIKL